MPKVFYKYLECEHSLEKISISSIECIASGSSFYYQVSIINSNNFPVYGEYLLNNVIILDSNFGPIGAMSTTTISIPYHRAEKFEFLFNVKLPSGEYVVSDKIDWSSYSCEMCDSVSVTDPDKTYNIYGFAHTNFIADPDLNIKLYDKNNNFIKETLSNNQYPYNYFMSILESERNSYDFESFHFKIYKNGDLISTIVGCELSGDCNNVVMEIPVSSYSTAPQLTSTPTQTSLYSTAIHSYRDLSSFISTDPIAVSNADIGISSATIISSTLLSRETSIQNFLQNGSYQKIYLTKFTYLVEYN